MEALVMGRLATGSQQNLGLEARMMDMMLSRLGPDGLYYTPKHGGKKPWLGPDETLPRASIHGQGRMMRAMVGWYQYTNNPAWKKGVDRMIDGWDKHLVVHKEDYAYVPTLGWIDVGGGDYCRACYTPRGWKDDKEPENEKGGIEGSLTCHMGHYAGVLANWYQLTGNKQALRLSGELVRFIMKPKYWADWKEGEYPGVVGAEHAHWQGHFHGHINTLRAILEYAIVTNDARLKAFVRDGYEWARQAGLARIGIVGDAQGCGAGRLTGLAIKLSDAGVGDYWEDVDLYTRNQGSEMQLVPEDIPHIKKMIAQHPNPPRPPEIVTDHPTGTNVNVIEASMGGFSMQYPPFKGGWALCCSPWGNLGLYYAWEGTLHYDEKTDTARINLLLNRASNWMDIDSYLPYEGKVVLKNKKAKSLFIRIPLWTDKTSVKCSTGDQQISPKWFGNYLCLQDLKEDDILTVTFPIEERVETWTAPPPTGLTVPFAAGTVFTFRFRGNTVVELTPPLFPDSWLYQNRPDIYKTKKSPMKKTTRYVTPAVLKW